tara:strand:+ start:587 stop:1072 length:486 start_codon:yes stop_codon:yes gene_type:complete
MPKDFKKHFTKDLEKAIIKGRKEVAKTVVRSLTEKGPWWTGTFGENWIVSKSPVQPTRNRNSIGFPFPEGPTTREIKTPRVPNVTLNQDLYVGNRAKYAGFAINAPGQTLRSLRGLQVTYKQHFEESTFPTAMAGNWYVIYTKGGFINKDISMAFKKVGFK